MRILLSMISLTRGKGGAERVAIELANELHARGHEVAIYSSSMEGEEPHYELNGNVRHIQIPLRNAEKVRQAILDFSPDVFFIFYATAHLLDQYALIAGSSIPVGVQECTNPIRVVENFNLRRDVPDIETAFALRKALLSGVHGIRLTMDSYINYLPAVARPSCRTYNNTFKRASSLADVGKCSGRKRIINVGGLKTKNKNGLVLARAFSQIAKEFPDWDLHFYGANSFPEISQIIEQNNLRERIILGGSKNNIYAEYSQSQLHVITSFEEGCPNVVCEAMLHGLPSIGFSDCPGTNELIIDGRNGVLVNRERETENLAAALRVLMSDASLRVRLGNAAYEEAIVRFDRRRIYDQWEELLRHIASYKADPQRLYSEQCLIDKESAEYMRRLRARFVKSYAQQYLDANPDALNANPDAAEWPKVSIVVPVFNKDKYLPETLSSILSSEYPDKEVIIVDDGSTDCSLEVAQEYARRHGNIKVIAHRKNDNLSSARNSGLSAATGEYIHFWDIGHIYSRNGLSRIIPVIETDGSDIVTGVVTRFGRVMPHYEPFNQLKRRREFRENSYILATGSCCSKIYRRSFLQKNGLSFAPGPDIQEVEFNWRAFMLANTVTATPYTLGECGDTGSATERAHCSDLIASSFKIADVTKIFLEERQLPAFEPVRQRYLLKTLFLSFVRELLVLKKKEALGASGEYLETYRKAIMQYRDGIVELRHDDPLWALGMVAFASGNDNLAFSLLVEGRDANCQSLCLENAFGFTKQQLSFLRQPLTKAVFPEERHMGAKRIGRVVYGYYDLLPHSIQRTLRGMRVLRSLKEKYLR